MALVVETLALVVGVHAYALVDNKKTYMVPKQKQQIIEWNLWLSFKALNH